MPAWLVLGVLLFAVGLACQAMRDTAQELADWADEYNEDGAFVPFVLDNADRKV